jgi:hypothetical protein
MIDWQHYTILPLFLHWGIPNSFQNYGDSVSESLQTPKLPRKFDDMEEREQFERKLKVDALDAAESTEERLSICENWIFDDFDEQDYL